VRFAQSDFKRGLLSFTAGQSHSVHDLGIGLATEAGISAAVVLVAHHITIQTALFTCGRGAIRAPRHGTPPSSGSVWLGYGGPILGHLFFRALR
jgi:multicomponent Na+:H+ antiporter subunit D